MTVLVLGATGFLGQHVLRELRQRGIAVIPSSQSLGLDLCDRTSVRTALTSWRPDAIVHGACDGGSVHFVMEHAADVIDANVRMVLNVYEAAAALSPKPLIINLLANCSYPAAVDVQSEDRWLEGPVHPSVMSFGNATRMKYAIAKCYAEQHGIRSINLLSGGWFGPLDHLEDHRLHAFDGLVLRIVRAKLSHEPVFKIWGTGKPVRECLFIKDAARAIVDALEVTTDVLYPLNLAQNFALSVNEIAAVVKRAVGYQGTLDHDLSYSDGAAVKVMDGNRFRAMFPTFAFTDFELAVQETADYYLEAVSRTMSGVRA